MISHIVDAQKGCEKDAVNRPSYNFPVQPVIQFLPPGKKTSALPSKSNNTNISEGKNTRRHENTVAKVSSMVPGCRSRRNSSDQAVKTRQFWISHNFCYVLLILGRSYDNLKLTNQIHYAYFIFWKYVVLDIVIIIYTLFYFVVKLLSSYGKTVGSTHWM